MAFETNRKCFLGIYRCSRELAPVYLGRYRKFVKEWALTAKKRYNTLQAEFAKEKLLVK